MNSYAAVNFRVQTCPENHPSWNKMQLFISKGNYRLEQKSVHNLYLGMGCLVFIVL